jgi:acetyl-CoA C-acetyltransferase
MSRDVFIVDGSRTPFLKAGPKPNPLPAADLAVAAAKPLLQRQPFAATDIGEVIIGCVGPNASEANIARIIALRIGCGNLVPGYTVQRNCASGLQAIDCATKDILAGRYDLVLAGGTEAMSRAGLFFNENMQNWLGDLTLSKTLGQKLHTILKFRPSFLVPVVSLLKALTDPVVNLNMGQTAENVAFEFDITRQQMDEFSVQSHLRAVAAEKNKYFEHEIEPLFDWQGKFYNFDNGVRPDSSIEKLAKLKPVFDKPFGLVTAGNSSQITDGAALVLLASGEAVKKYNLKPLARIVDFAWSALDPAIMGMGPAYSIAALLKKNNLPLSAIDYFEINEAFAAQVLACVKVLDDAKYCAEHFGSATAFGKIDLARLNVDGGAIAVGHPVGASGARLALHLAHVLQRNKAKLGIASLCIGGGQGGAVLIENVMEGV